MECNYTKKYYPSLALQIALTDVGEIVLTYFKMWYIIIITTNEMVSMRTHRRTPPELQLRRRSFFGLIVSDFLSVKPLANVVTNYRCQNRKNE